MFRRLTVRKTDRPIWLQEKVGSSVRAARIQKPKMDTAAQTKPRAVWPGVRRVDYFMLLYRKVTIWPLVQVAPGLNVVAEVPLVIWGLWLTAHRTAS